MKAQSSDFGLISKYGLKKLEYRVFNKFVSFFLFPNKSKDDPLPESESVKELKNIIDSHAEPIRIENLLVELQRKTNYMRAFKPLEGFKRREPLELRTLNAGLTGHATNLGLYGMSRNCDGMTGDKLSYVSNYYITPENLKKQVTS